MLFSITTNNLKAKIANNYSWDSKNSLPCLVIKQNISNTSKYNLVFFKRKNINYLSEDFYLLIYLLIITSIIFVFFNYEKNFLNKIKIVNNSILPIIINDIRESLDKNAKL